MVRYTMRQISFETGRWKHHWNKISKYFSIFLFKIFSSSFNIYIFRAKNWRTMSEVWLCALSCNKDQVSGSRYFGWIRRIVAIRRFKTSRWYASVIVSPVGTNSLWIIPLLWKNVMSSAEIGFPSRLSTQEIIAVHLLHQPDCFWCIFTNLREI